MKIGQTIKWGKIGSLGLPALEHTVQASEFRQEVKVYKVPKAVDSSRYWVSATPANAVEEAPPSRVRETDLLVRFTLSPDGEAQLSYVRPEVQAA
jgi:hypothetical protein